MKQEQLGNTTESLFDAEKKDISFIEDRIKKVKEFKDHNEGIIALGEGDRVPGAGGDVEKIRDNENYLREEKGIILKKVEYLFYLIKDEVFNGGEITSSSGKVYEPDQIMKYIDAVLEAAKDRNRHVELPLLLNLITRGNKNEANNYRERVKKMVALLLEVDAL